MEEGLIPRQFALHNLISPRVIRNGDRCVIRSVSALSPETLSEIGILIGSYVQDTRISYEEFQKEFEETYPDGKTSVNSGDRFKVIARGSDISSAKHEVDGAPVVKMVDEIISRAIEISASDIHLEPREKCFALRYRLDGVLQEQPGLPFDKMPAIISRLKIMADLDIAERRRPQDGRIRVESRGKSIDLRVSIIPTDFGEKIAIRILDKTQLKLEIENLGMAKSQIVEFQKALLRPNGIILVTGPTGSGKTTTLYAALNYLKSPEINILTIEDPIEYNLDGVNQSQVKREIGYDFATALRTFLRQDPDVILVGEIRDLETAEIAIRASLTGHLVLSTLHTNDAASAITRLIDIGIEPYLVASSLNLVMAQRLLRVLCPYCKESYQASMPEVNEFRDPRFEGATICKPTGCPKCLKTGFVGRSAAFELMPISDEISEMIDAKASLAKIKEAALGQGMKSLRQAGLGKVIEGATSIKEMKRSI